MWLFENGIIRQLKLYNVYFDEVVINYKSVCIKWYKIELFRSFDLSSRGVCIRRYSTMLPELRYLTFTYSDALKRDVFNAVFTFENR